ncbi:MAG: ABC transporter substrate-binding protein [bacterium]|nr:ABC transporter substrate-binding protein [Gammaproteobacteria bacterium]
MPTGRTIFSPVAVLVYCLSGTSTTLASGLLGLEHDWPQAWFEAAKTASEMGITEFSQSPVLDELDLPSVEKRLPDDPLVIVPLNDIGIYGGRAHISANDGWQFFNWEHALTISADMRSFLPNLAEYWTVSEDGRTITLKLRKGIKWSDGAPLTSDDFMFTFNNIWLDKEFSPVTSRLILGGEIVKIDALTFKYVFKDPNPLFVNLIAQYGHRMVDPKHYYQKFHPSFTNRDDVIKHVESLGYINWTTFMTANREGRIKESVNAPTLRAYKIVSRTPALIRFERNPYYFKVDPQGQQLPYIDAIDAEVITNAEVIAAKASTGQLDFAAFALRTQDFPLLKLGERTGVVKVHEWKRLHTSDVVIQMNFNHANPRLRQVYWDLRFRQALSIAINRNEMNEIIYFGRGTPHQVTVHPSSSFYEPHFATSYIQYDPQQARSLLDEMGLKDIDDDGLREYADGSKFTITIEFYDFETPKGISMELVASYWREVGIDLRLKLVDGNLQSVRAEAGEMEMTLWHGDKSTDILFPLIPYWWAPRSTAWDLCMWNDWARYYQTDGRLGEKPPAIIKQLQDWTDEMRITMDNQQRITIGKKILQSNADNLWTIGTVGLAPQPILVSRRLQNVSAHGIWGWDNRWTLAYHPATWYLNDPDVDTAKGLKVVASGNSQ